MRALGAYLLGWGNGGVAWTPGPLTWRAGFAGMGACTLFEALHAVLLITHHAYAMLLLIKNCSACAAPLPDLGAKQCSRCKTRYCSPACQVQHWKEGGHDKLCKKIKNTRRMRRRQ